MRGVFQNGAEGSAEANPRVKLNRGRKTAERQRQGEAGGQIQDHLSKGLWLCPDLQGGWEGLPAVLFI